MPNSVPTDPYDLDLYPAHQATDDWLPEGEATDEQRERLDGLLLHLDDLSADVVDLCLLRGIDQVRTATILRVSQPTVSYRLRRAVAHMRYWARMPPVDLPLLREVLSEFPFGGEQASFLRAVAEEGTVVEAARVLGLTQEPWVLKRRLRWMTYLPLPIDALARYQYILENEPQHVSRFRDYLGRNGTKMVIC